LVSALDPMFLHRRELKSLLDPKDMDREVFTDKSSKPIASLSDLPSFAILDRGRIVGLWEFDTTSNTIAWTSFVKKDQALKEAVARMEVYVRDQLGDARSFSLDSPKSRAPRVEYLRKAAGA